MLTIGIDQMSDSPHGWLRKHRAALTIAAEVAAVLAVLVPAGGWLIHRATGGPRGSAPATASSPAAPPADATTATGANAPSPARYFVADLPPYSGGPNRVALPHTLAGQADYSHALVIGCPSNQSGDRYRSVTYNLAKRYVQFHATLLPFLGAPDESKVRFEVYLDDQLKSQVDVVVNDSRALDTEVYGATRMEVRVSCERPDAVGILADGYLVHA